MHEFGRGAEPVVVRVDIAFAELHRRQGAERGGHVRIGCRPVHQQAVAAEVSAGINDKDRHRGIGEVRTEVALAKSVGEVGSDVLP